MPTAHRVLGDTALEVDPIVGGQLFALAHRFAIALSLRHPREWRTTRAMAAALALLLRAPTRCRADSFGKPR